MCWEEQAFLLHNRKTFSTRPFVCSLPHLHSWSALHYRDISEIIYFSLNLWYGTNGLFPELETFLMWCCLQACWEIPNLSNSFPSFPLCPFSLSVFVVPWPTSRPRQTNTTPVATFCWKQQMQHCTAPNGEILHASGVHCCCRQGK